MPSDKELYLERHIQYGNMRDSEAANTLAQQHGLSPDSVRGRLSRANNSENNLLVAKALASTLGDSPSVQRQQAVIEKSVQELEKLTPKRIAFVSDIHLPYPRWDALELTARILDDFSPDETTAQNDFLDNTGYGRWDDDRSPQDKAWTGDLERLRRLERQVYRMWKGKLIGIMGNHDRWFFSHIRKQSPQSAEKIIADYMDWLYEDCGVLQFSNGQKENALLRDKVVLWHGQFASKNPLSNAKSSLAQFMSDGTAHAVVVGHTHRPFQVDGSAVGYDGVEFVNSPCLCSLEPPYMKRDPKGWGLGITLIEDNIPYLIRYQQRGKELVAFALGKEYKTRVQR